MPIAATDQITMLFLLRTMRVACLKDKSSLSAPLRWTALSGISEGGMSDFFDDDVMRSFCNVRSGCGVSRRSFDPRESKNKTPCALSYFKVEQPKPTLDANKEAGHTLSDTNLPQN